MVTSFLIFINLSFSASMPKISSDGKSVVYIDGNDLFYIEYNNNEWECPIKLYSNANYPSINGDGNKIIFITNEGIFFIQRVNSSWQNPVKLSTNYSNNTTGISDDGNKVVFRGSDASINVMMFNGSSWGNSVIIGNGQDPKMSKNGNAIVFHKYVNTDDEIYYAEYINLSWKEAVAITSNSVYDRNPSINSDGSKVVFFRYNTTIHVLDYFENNWSVSNVATVPCCDSYPSINQDGTKVAVKNLLVTYENGSWQPPITIATSGQRPSINSDGTKIVLVIDDKIAFIDYNNNQWSEPIYISEIEQCCKLTGKILTSYAEMGYTASVGGATIISTPANLSVTTDIYGNFLFTSIPTGNCLLEVASSYFESISKSIQIEQGNNEIVLTFTKPKGLYRYTQEDIDNIEQQKNQTIAQLTQNIAEKYTELSEKESMISSKEETIDQLSEAISEMYTELSEKEDIISSKEETIVQLSQTISVMYTIGYLEKAIEEAEKRGELKYDINADGKVGLEEVIKYLENLSGVRIESLIVFPDNKKLYLAD